MKIITRYDVRRFIHRILLIILDVAIILALIANILYINKANATDLVPLLIILCGLLPFIVCQHIKSISKQAETMCMYLMGFSGTVIPAFIFLKDVTVSSPIEIILFNLLVTCICVFLCVIIIVNLCSTRSKSI